MGEYIEKQALLKKMHSSHSTPLFMGHMTDEDVMFQTMVSIVEELPTADVVEVVRCKDCGMSRETEEEEYLVCMQFADTVGFQAFCSYGERKCEDGKQ